MLACLTLRHLMHVLRVREAHRTLRHLMHVLRVPSLFDGMQLMMEAVAGSRRERYTSAKCAKVGTRVPPRHLPALCTVCRV